MMMADDDDHDDDHDDDDEDDDPYGSKYLLRKWKWGHDFGAVNRTFSGCVWTHRG